MNCANCTNLGQVCNAVSLICTPGTAGGGAGGGFAGGPGQLGDDCTSAIPLTLFSGSASTSGSLTGFVNDTTACSGTGPDAVYSVTLNTPGALTARVDGFGFTPRVSVRSFCTSTSTLACDSVGTSGVATTPTNQLGAGTYFVWVDSSSSLASGSYSLTVTSSGSGGGGAGGGFAGGFGGGGAASGNYVATSITASCDDLTFGQTALLSGTALSDDSASSVFALPISFQFFGSPVSNYGVQSNGMAQFFTSSSGLVSTSFSNTTIPSSAGPNGFAAPFWDDLYPTTSPLPTLPSISSKVVSTGGTHLTISWTNVARSGATSMNEFQAKFFSTGVVEYHYCSIGGLTGGTPSIGLEDSLGTTGTQYSPTVSTGSGVRFTYVP
jgi:hypothetical protein